MDATLYVGVTTLILSIIGIKEFFYRREVKFALVILFLAIFFSTENSISTFLYNHGIWGGTSITMNRINFVINFAFAFLGAYGISALKNSEFKLSIKPALWIVAGAIGIILGSFLSTQILKDWVFLAKEGLLADFEAMFDHIDISLKNLILPTAIAVLTLGIFMIAKWVKPIRKFIPIIFTIVLVAELFRFGWKFNTFSEPEFAYPETTLTNYLQRFPDDRVVAEADVVPANMWVPFKISSIAGYDGLYPLRMAKLLAVANADDIEAAPLSRWGILNKFNSRILDASGTRFVLATKMDKGVLSPNGTVNYLLQAPNLKEVFSQNSVVVLENQDSFPKAYLTSQVIKSSDKEMLHALVSKTFPLRSISLAEDLDFNNPITEPIKSEINYQQITNSHIQVKTISDQDAYLVVLDGFYPGWKAFIDGSKTTIYRTNFNFRGVLLSKGKHLVDFKYQPISLAYGTFISGISLLIIVFILTLSYLKKKN